MANKARDGATKGVISATYWEGQYPREMTLSVDHPDGTHTLVVVAIDRMTCKLSGQSFKPGNREVD